VIRAALGDATSVVNIGAGSGSYEPTDLAVVPVEPSELMIRQRPPSRQQSAGQLGRYRCRTRAWTGLSQS
jgi:hypothetical protein